MGPAGGTIYTAGGAIVEFPEGALERTTPVSVTFTRETRFRSSSGTRTPWVFPSVHLDLGGTSLSKPVKVSIPLPHAPSQRAAIPVFTRNEQTLGWDSTGVADLSSDGLWGSFSMSSQSGGVFPDVRTSYELYGFTRYPGMLVQETRVECVPGPFLVPTTITAPPGVLLVDEFESPLYNQAGVAQEVSEIEIDASGTTEIKAGQKRTLVLRIYDDIYIGKGRGLSKMLINGEWQTIHHEDTDVLYIRRRYVYSLRKCHEQGEGEP